MEQYIDPERAREIILERRKRLSEHGFPANAGQLSDARFDGTPTVLSESTNPLIRQRYGSLLSGADRNKVAAMVHSPSSLNPGFTELKVKKQVKPVDEKYRQNLETFTPADHTINREAQEIESWFDPDMRGGGRSYSTPNPNAPLDTSSFRAPAFDPNAHLRNKISQAQQRTGLDFRELEKQQPNQFAVQQYSNPSNIQSAIDVPEYAKYMTHNYNVQPNSQQQPMITMELVHEMASMMAEKAIKKVMEAQQKKGNNNKKSESFIRVEGKKDKNGREVKNLVEMNGKYYLMELREVNLTKKKTN